MARRAADQAVRETGGLFGLTKNISTYNPVRVATHEYAAIGRDVRAARSWRERASRVLRGPGWQPGPATAEGPGGVEPPGPSGVRVPQQATAAPAAPTSPAPPT